MKIFYENQMIVLISVIMVLSLLIFFPFTSTILLAYFSIFLIKPLYNKIHKKIKNNTIAITVVMLIVFLLFIVPVVSSGLLIYHEIINFDAAEVFGYSGFSLNDYINNTIQLTVANTPININAENAISVVTNIVSSLPSVLFNNAINIGNFLVIAMTNLIIYIVLLPIMLVNYDKINNLIYKLIPLNDYDFKVDLVDKVNRMFSAIFKGTIITGLIQALISFIYFVILGIPNSVVISFLVFITTIIPNASFIVFLAISIFYIVSDNLFLAIFNLLFYAIVIASVDNVVRPIITRKNVTLNPVITVLSIIGGLALFGFWGLFYGPMILLIIIELIKKYLYTVD